MHQCHKNASQEPDQQGDHRKEKTKQEHKQNKRVS